MPSNVPANNEPILALVLMAGIVVRADIAHSNEATNAWVMVDHPF